MSGAPVINPENSMAASLKDAFLAALLTGVLGFFFLGLKTDIAPGGLVLNTRWGLYITAIAIVFFGRVALNVFVFRTDKPVTSGLSGQILSPSTGEAISWWLKRGLFAFAVILPFFFYFLFPGRDRQFIDLAILIMTYIMLGWGLNIVVGLAGLLDLGYVAFYAVGAYSFALLSQHFGIGFWMALPLAGILAAFWGIILGFPVLRLRGDYLAIVTLAFGEIIRVVLLNWYDFTGGPNGLNNLPKPSFFGLEFKRGEGGFADFFGSGDSADLVADRTACYLEKAG